MRDADVTDAVTQKNCATTQMKSSASDQRWLIDSAQIQGMTTPMFSSAPSVLGMAAVTASSRIQPKTTDATTDMYIPTAAMREALPRLLRQVGRCVEPRDRVLRHQEAESKHEPEGQM